MFSETRYAMNGDLRVAYRVSREGSRDIVFVPNWFTCCDHLPELPSIQGWVEAMTSLGRLIFFVSRTLRDLVIGSGLGFEDRGAHGLKGVPGEWRIFAVASS